MHKHYQYATREGHCRHRGEGGPRGGFGGFPFGGFGGPGGGGPWRGGGRKARRGDIRTAALLLLAEEPRNGYQIMQEIAGAQRRRLAPQPRLGLPRPAAARGRGPDPLRGGGRAQALPAHRRGSRAGQRARSRAARAVGADERRVWLEGTRARQDHARGRRRLRAGDAHRQRGAAGGGAQGARRRASRAYRILADGEGPMPHGGAATA